MVQGQLAVIHEGLGQPGVLHIKDTPGFLKCFLHRSLFSEAFPRIGREGVTRDFPPLRFILPTMSSRPDLLTHDGPVSS